MRDGGSPAPLGVNVVGYFRAELGVGEAARLLVKAVEAADIPFVTISWDRTRSRQEHPFGGESATEPRYDTTILCVNADQVRAFAEHAGPSFFEGRYTIGQWMWEVETFPETMFEGFDYVDEIWAASEHAARALSAVSPKPVLLMPPPLVVPEFTRRARRDLGLPEGFVFLFVFDFLSVFERKNPVGLVEAFSRAFAPGEGPTLVIKSINGDVRPELLDRLRRAAAERPDITIMDGYVSAGDKNALIASADAFVSLHRSEGLGLTMAEAMLLGKPVIATAYSGNLLFMNDQNSFLVPYEPTPIPDGCDPYPAGDLWAAPDIDAAAAHLRRVFFEAGARAIGERAREELLTHHSPAVRGRQVARRLEQVRRWSRPGADTGRIPRAGSAGRPSAPRRLPRDEAGSFVDALARVEELIARGPEIEHGSRFGEGGRVFRRGLLRVLRPYAWHQRRVASALVAAIKEVQRRQSLTSIETVVWLIDRVGRLQGEVGRLQARLPSRFDDVAGRLEMLSDELDSLRMALDETQRTSDDSTEGARLT